MGLIIEQGPSEKQKWRASDGVDFAYGETPDNAVLKLQPLLKKRAALNAKKAAEQAAKQKAELETQEQQRQELLAANNVALRELFKVVKTSWEALKTLRQLEGLNERGMLFILQHGRLPKDAYTDWSEYKAGYKKEVK